MTKTKINKADLEGRSFNRSVACSSINDEIKNHQERSLKGVRDGEAEKLAECMEKLKKIERNRKKAQEKKEL